MKKTISLTFSKFRENFQVKDIEDAQSLLIKLDNGDVLKNLHFTSNYEDDHNWFISFEATISAKKTLHIINKILTLYYHWSNFVRVSSYKSDLLNNVAIWTLNIEVKE